MIQKIFGKKIPSSLPILPLRDTVVFPNIVTPLVVAREKSVQLINDVIAGSRMLGLVSQKDVEKEDPGPDDIYKYGTAAIILRMLKFPDGSHRVLVQGISRIKVLQVEQEDPYLSAKILQQTETTSESTEVEAFEEKYCQSVSKDCLSGAYASR